MMNTPHLSLEIKLKNISHIPIYVGNVNLMFLYITETTDKNSDIFFCIPQLGWKQSRHLSGVYGASINNERTFSGSFLAITENPWEKGIVFNFKEPFKYDSQIRISIGIKKNKITAICPVMQKIDPGTDVNTDQLIITPLSKSVSPLSIKASTDVKKKEKTSYPVFWVAQNTEQTNLSEQEVFSTLNSFKKISLGLFSEKLSGVLFAQGWENPIGETFPRWSYSTNPGHTLRIIQSFGYRVGLWTSPLIVSTKSSIGSKKADILIHDTRNNPVRFNLYEECFILNPEKSETIQHIHERYQILHEMGFNIFVLEHISEALHRTDVKFNSKTIRNVLKTIREAVSNDSILFASDIKSQWVQDVIDYEFFHISPDFPWEKLIFFARKTFQEKLLLSSSTPRGLWLPDFSLKSSITTSPKSADNLQDSHSPEIEKMRILLTLQLFQDGPLFLSGSPASWDNEIKSSLQNLLEMKKNLGSKQFIPLNPHSAKQPYYLPSLFVALLSQGPLIAIFNWTKKENIIDIKDIIKYFKLTAEHLIYDVWDNSAQFIGEMPKLKISPRSVKLYQIEQNYR